MLHFRRSRRLLRRIIIPVFSDSSQQVLILESAKQVDSLLNLKQSPYAIRLAPGKATSPVRLNEARQVLCKLALKYWPGPIQMYMSVKEDECNIPPSLFQSFRQTTYIPLSCPSHPLLGRVLTEVKTRFGAEHAVIGSPTSHTSARDVCDDANFPDMHVLFGEDKREIFHVPTCSFGRQCKVSLWIHAEERIVYIVGCKEESVVQVSPTSLTSALLQMSNPNNVEQRVVCAVLKKWKIVDQRT